MNAQPTLTPEQEQAALTWLCRISDEPTCAQGPEFKRWLLADPAHGQAWRQVSQLWERSAEPALRLAEEEAAALNRYLHVMDAPERRWTSRVAGLAVAACLVLGVMAGAGWHPVDWVDDLGADYVADVGQIRSVTLPDRSELVLDAGSAISVDFSHGQRQVEVRRGAVFFHVSHTGEPFIVNASGGEARVLGTQFEVRREGEGGRVTVLSGKVGVTAAPGQPQQVLTAGQQVAYAAGVATPLQGVGSQSRLAWRQGWLNYYQRPLAEVVDDLSRYYPGRIVLLGEGLGQRTVSGSFPANDPLAALDALGSVLGFKRQTLLGRLTVLR